MKKSTLVLLGFLAVGTVACSNAHPSPTSPSPVPAPAPTPAPGSAPVPTPPPTPSGPFTQTLTGMVGRFENVFHDFTVPRPGTMTVKLRWTGTEDIDLGLTPGGCRIDESGCEVIAESAESHTNIEQFSTPVTEAQALRIWVSGSLQPVSYTIEIDIR